MKLKFLIAIVLAATLFFAARSIAQQTTPPTLEEKLEQERLAALPGLKAQLEDRKLRERSDVVIVLREGFFDTIFAEMTGRNFNVGGLFTVTINNPRITLRNGLALVRMEAQPSIGNRLQVAAKLLVEQGESGALTAKFQVVELKPIGEQTAASPGLTPEQLSSILPPLTLPLEFDFDRNVQFGSMKQSKPIALEVEAEPRKISGHFEVVSLLPLDGRLAVFARARDVSVQ
jgi:hypothetical protein